MAPARRVPMPLPPEASLMLRFRLPVTLQLCVGPGRWQPCIHKARVDVGDEGDVEIRVYEPRSEVEARRIAFDQARRFLIAIAGGASKLPLANFSGQLRKADRPERYEHYEIVTGAAISITHAYQAPAAVA
jgi:hypothetical protein